MKTNQGVMNVVAGGFIQSAGTTTLGNNSSLSTISQNLLSGPMAGLQGLIGAACYIISIILMISAIQKWQHHRHNPHEASLTNVIIYFLLSIFMFLIPFAPHLTKL